MASGKINIGDKAKITVIWTPETAGTTVLAEQTLTVKLPDGSTVSYTSVSSPAVSANGTVQDSYRLDFPCTQAGTHEYRWVSTPTVAAAEQGFFNVIEDNTV